MTGIKSTSRSVHIIGAGLAGSEAAWQVAKSGIPVVLHEMRPHRMTESHQTSSLAELVCSNSFRSDDAANNAVGLLHAEMRRLGSLIMRAADANQVPAGGALAVDRDGFSAEVTKALHDHPLIQIDRTEIAGLPPADWRNVIVATGPLTSAPLADAIRGLTDESALAFFDAIAPIVHRDSIDMSVAWFQSRQDNKLGTLYNMVGFQTKLKHGAQQRVFRTIPGLENAEFARLGGLHRNTFLNSPKLLDAQLRLRAAPRLRFAGQITGCEGYVESAAVGLMAGRFAAAERLGRASQRPPATTAMGALLGHITGGADARSFQPM